MCACVCIHTYIYIDIGDLFIFLYIFVMIEVLNFIHKGLEKSYGAFTPNAFRASGLHSKSMGTPVKSPLWGVLRV